MRTRELRTRKVTAFYVLNGCAVDLWQYVLRIALLSDPNPYPSNNKNGNNIIHKTTRGDGTEEKAVI